MYVKGCNHNTGVLQALAPLMFSDASKNICHYSVVSCVGGALRSVHSVIKSMRACDLTVVPL